MEEYYAISVIASSFLAYNWILSKWEYGTSYNRLLEQYNSLESEYKALKGQYAELEDQYSTLMNQYNSLQSQYNSLNAEYQSLAGSHYTFQLHIGTTLETYYDYVRANVVTIGGEPLGEERWYQYPAYYNNSALFAADEAAHDAGDLYWPSMESGCNYYNYTGENSYQTSSNIMNQAMALAGITSSDSAMTKIDKVLGFINSNIHYENKLLDHMWFPCETLTFHSGDCTSFSILAAAMLEKAGIKTAIGLFYNSTMGEGHAMILVHLDDIDPHGSWYYKDLTSYGLTSGKWIIIEPQFSSLTVQDARLYNWVNYWVYSLKACVEVPYGP